MAPAATVVFRELLLTLLVVVALWLSTPASDAQAKAVQLALAAISLTAVLLRRRAPRRAFFIVAATTTTAWALGLTDDPFVLAAACLYLVAVRDGRRMLPPWPLAAMLFCVLFAAVVGAPGLEESVRYVLVSGIVLLGVWALGVSVRTARSLAAENAVTQERARLARDVHDVLSHSLGTIGVRAGVAAHIETASVVELRRTLREIEEQSRSSIAELKQLLAATRDGEMHRLVPHSFALRDLLDETAAHAEKAGLETSLVVELPETLDAELALVIHRVAREAVTNTIRHAQAKRCRIRITCEAQGIQLRVSDDGVGRQPHSPEGHGLRGIRERIAALGGTLSVDNSGAGGFELVVTLSPSAVVLDD